MTTEISYSIALFQRVISVWNVQFWWAFFSREKNFFYHSQNELISYGPIHGVTNIICLKLFLFNILILISSFNMLILIKDTQIGVMPVVDHLYILKKGLLKCQMPQFITPTWLNTELPKMVKHTIKILQQMLQIISDHFGHYSRKS